MELNRKIAFENDFKDAFNEIWLSRILFSFWHVVLWNPDDIQPGMMFMLNDKHHSRLDDLIPGTVLSHGSAEGIFTLDDFNMMRAIREPLIITEFKKDSHRSIIYFQPIGLNVDCTDVWKNICKIHCHCLDVYTFT
jgi:hypothetical protein